MDAFGCSLIAMGALHLGRCYDSSASAQDVAYSSVLPVIDGPLLRVINNSGGKWYQVTYSGVRVVSSSLAPDLTFQSCNPASYFAEGSSYGFVIAVVWLVSYGFVVMKRTFR